MYWHFVWKPPKSPVFCKALYVCHLIIELILVCMKWLSWLLPFCHNYGQIFIGYGIDIVLRVSLNQHCIMNDATLLLLLWPFVIFQRWFILSWIYIRAKITPERCSQWWWIHSQDLDWILICTLAKKYKYFSAKTTIYKERCSGVTRTSTACPNSLSIQSGMPRLSIKIQKLSYLTTFIWRNFYNLLSSNSVNCEKFFKWK